MSWHRKTTEILADTLRFVLRSAAMVDVIIVAVGSIYVTFRLTWRLVQWLDASLLQPWVN